MPRRKKTETATPERTTARSVETVSAYPIMLPPMLQKVLSYLAVAFTVVWLVIGIFVLLVIIQGFRRGAYTGLLSSADTTQQQTSQDNTTQPTEADLPGIGRVNISCVQQALSPESLQKVLQSKDISVLQGDEKAKFQACITQPATPAPSASPSGQ